MQQPNRTRWTARDILALAVVALCALIIVATLLRPGVGFEPLMPLVVGAVGVVVNSYFGKVDT